MQKYTATYQVKHGVSHGFGIKYDCESDESKTFEAQTVVDALREADNYAENMADNYLCGNDGKVVVRMTEITDDDGNAINVLETLKRAVPASKALDDFVKDRFPDGRTLTTVRTVADHILDEILKKK